jgi:hypothetical protein
VQASTDGWGSDQKLIDFSMGAPSSSLRLLERQGGLSAPRTPLPPCRSKKRNDEDGAPIWKLVFLQVAQKLFYFSKLGEELFFGLKLGGVDAPSAAAQSYRVLEMEHLVIDDVLDR